MTKFKPFARLAVAILLGAGGLMEARAQEETPPAIKEQAATKTVKIGGKEVTLKVGDAYSVNLKNGERVRGEFLNATDKLLKLAVSRSADGLRADVVYLPFGTIASIDERKAPGIRIREELPSDIVDPYGAMNDDLDRLAALEGRETPPATPTPETPPTETPATPDEAATPTTATPTDPSAATPPGATDLGAVDAATAVQVAAVIDRLPPLSAEEQADPARQDAIANDMSGAVSALRALGPSAIPVLAANLAGYNARQLDAAAVVMIGSQDRRVVPILRTEYDKRGLVPPASIYQPMARIPDVSVSSWLVGIIGSEASGDTERRLAATALLGCPKSNEVAQELSRLVVTMPPGSTVTGGLLAAIETHATEGSEALFTLLERANDSLATEIIGQLINQPKPGNEERLIDLASNASESVADRIASAMLFRLSGDTGTLMLGWLVDYLSQTGNTQLLSTGLTALSRFKLPGRPPAGQVEYEPLILAALDPEQSDEILDQGLTALEILARDATTNEGFALLAAWRALEGDQESASDEQKAFLERAAQVARKIADRPIGNADSFETWLNEKP